MHNMRRMWNCRIQYSGKLSREKTLANFTVLWLLAKVFSVKIVFLPIHESFLPRKFPTIWFSEHSIQVPACIVDMSTTVTTTHDQSLPELTTVTTTPLPGIT